MEKKINLASDDAYIQAFNRLKATHDVSKKVNINIKNDSRKDDDDRDDKSITSKISSSQSYTSNFHKNSNSSTSNTISTKLKRNLNNVMQVYY